MSSYGKDSEVLGTTGPRTGSDERLNSSRGDRSRSGWLLPSTRTTPRFAGLLALARSRAHLTFHLLAESKMQENLLRRMKGRPLGTVALSIWSVRPRGSQLAQAEVSAEVALRCLPCGATDHLPFLRLP